MKYIREILVNVLVYHWRTNNSGCGCGWAELGRSHAEHVADIYEQSVQNTTVLCTCQYGPRGIRCPVHHRKNHG